MAVNFDTQAVDPLAAGVTGIIPKGVVQHAGTNAKTDFGNPYPNNFGPRVGAAWQIDSKTVVREGHGRF